ncbi:MAG: discoidin domain-containing protein, partial [bacterium]
MKKYLKLIGSFLVVLTVVSFVIKAEAAATDKDLVYLKAVGAVASSFDDTAGWAPDPNPMAPVDGKLETRWSPKYKDNEWIYFDFGKPKVLTTMAILWERAFVVDYEILISDDTKTWKTVVLLKNQNGNVDIIRFEPVRGRYLKIVGLKRVNPLWGFSVWEVLLLGPRESNQGEKTLKETYPNFGVELEEILSGEFSITPVKEPPLDGNGPIGKDEFQAGVVFTSWHETEIATKKSDVSIKHLYDDDNVRFLSVMVNWYQEDINSTVIGRDKLAGSTPMDEAVGHAINYAHSLGMKVMLKPHVDVHSGDGRQYIIPSVDWFASYTEFILHYAEIAEEYNVELFCVGTELTQTTTPRWDKTWRTIIFEIRKAYKGQITYAANWDEYPDVTFWDTMDFIGIDAYFPLTDNPDAPPEDLEKSWQSYADEIEYFLKVKKYNKPVILTELGYANFNGCNAEPWLSCPQSPVEDQEEQADAFDTAMSVLSERPWFK